MSERGNLAKWAVENDAVHLPKRGREDDPPCPSSAYSISAADVRAKFLTRARAQEGETGRRGLIGRFCLSPQFRDLSLS